MSKKKDRAFFICPRWAEVAGSPPPGNKTLDAIAAGRPVARSSLRRALIDAQRRTGRLFDVDGYLLDTRKA